MKFNCAGVDTHLSYCTNIHSGDDWEDVFAHLQTHLPAVRDALGFDGPMGIGLRVSRSAAGALTDAQVLAEFRQWMGDNEHYVYTINGFPYGTFHGERVKEDVYKPDWTEESRVEYTCMLADLLVALDPPGGYGTISTLPGTYKDWVMSGTEAAMAENLIRTVAHLARLEIDTGVTIALALEPEPCCFLETIAETIEFFGNWLHTEQAIRRLSELAGLDQEAAESAMHRLIGACYDVCHSAVEFETPAHAITRLQTAGIPITKIQLSSALKIEQINESTLRRLSRFDEPVYLHQVVENHDGRLTRFHDLHAACKSARFRFDQRASSDARLALPMAAGALALDNRQVCYSPSLDQREWRVHFHVPIFLEQLEHFGTTQAELRQLLALQAQSGISPHLEVETYTWDVLPEELRQRSIAEAIAGELRWASEHLQGVADGGPDA